MRELKFRVWCPTSKHFSTLPWLSCDGLMMKWEHTSNKSTLTDIRFDEYIIQQYTGLKDKNGTEIYEGDIVKNEDGFIGEVKWCDSWNCFKLKQKYSNGDYSNGLFLNPNVLGNVEIIGNIFENPEPLKE